MINQYEESLRLSREWLDSHTKEDLEEILKNCPKDGPTVEEYFRAVRPRGLDIKLTPETTSWGLVKRYSMPSQNLEAAINGDMTREEIEDFAQHVILNIESDNSDDYFNSYVDDYFGSSTEIEEAKIFDNKFDAELYCIQQEIDLKEYKIVPVFTDTQPKGNMETTYWFLKDIYSDPIEVQITSIQKSEKFWLNLVIDVKSKWMICNLNLEHKFNLFSHGSNLNVFETQNEAKLASRYLQNIDWIIYNKNKFISTIENASRTKENLGQLEEIVKLMNDFMENE